MKKKLITIGTAALMILFGTAGVQAKPDPEQMALGKATYATCIACHGIDGKGMQLGEAGIMAPSLVKSPYVLGNSDVLALIILKGIVKDAATNFAGVMAPLESALNDERLAAVMTYVRNSFGNKADPVTEAEARAARTNFAKIAGSVERTTIANLLEKTRDVPSRRPPLSGNANANLAPTKQAGAPSSPLIAPGGHRNHEGSHARTYDLDFPGGSLRDYIDYLDKALGIDENLLAAPSDGEKLVPALKLKNVTFRTMINMLELATADERHALSFMESDGSWVVRVRETKPQPERMVRSYALGNLDSDSELEDVFALVTEAFKLQGSEPPNLRYHEETKTLLAVVDSTQAEVLQGLMAQVMTTASTSRPTIASLEKSVAIFKRQARGIPASVRGTHLRIEQTASAPLVGGRQEEHRDSGVGPRIAEAAPGRLHQRSASGGEPVAR